MEQIKKYNYRDPLHQKGDPFGATEAKVAHVNDVITEVNSIDTRVAALENAPAPQGSTEYYINGNIISMSDDTFSVYVTSHNTPVRNIDGAFENIIAFAETSTNIYQLYFQGTANITADLGNGEEVCNITHATTSSFSINTEPGLIFLYSQTPRPFITMNVIPNYLPDEAINTEIAQIINYNMVSPSSIAARKITPSSETDILVYNFQIKFSEFTVVPA